MGIVRWKLPRHDGVVAQAQVPPPRARGGGVVSAHPGGAGDARIRRGGRRRVGRNRRGRVRRLRRERQKGVLGGVGHARHPRGSVAAGEDVRRVRDTDGDSKREPPPIRSQSGRVCRRAHGGVPGAEQRSELRNLRLRHSLGVRRHDGRGPVGGAGFLRARPVGPADEERVWRRVRRRRSRVEREGTR